MMSIRRQSAAAASLIVGALLASAGAVEAQGRMRVLVPAFTNEQGQTTRTGQRLAEQVRRQINELPTHAPLEDRAWRDALRKHGLREADMDCIKWTQLARLETAMNAALVLCGTYDESTGVVTGQFYPAAGGDAFELEPFTFESQQQVAQHIVVRFQTYTRQLSLVQYCDEHIRSENWTEALRTCSEAIELNPRSTSANYARGSALLQLNRREEALAAFEAVIEVDPINTDALLGAGYTAAQLQRQDVSQQYLREYLSLNPGAVQVRLSIAAELANQGDPSGALRLVEEVGDADATAQVYTYAGHFATNAGLQARQAGPAGAETPGGTEYFHKAIANYERVLAMAPDSIDPRVHRQLMLAYRYVSNVDRALEIGERVTAGDTDAQTLSVYADVLKEAGRAVDAIVALDRAAQLDPELPNLRARRGVLLFEEGRLGDAMTTFREALANDEISAAHVEQLSQQMSAAGYERTQQRRYDDAVAYFDAARELGKSEVSIGMANFFHGFMLVTQADALLRNATTAAPARQARPILDRARILLEAAGAYTPQAEKRAELLRNVADYISVADALIRAGR